MLIPTDILLDVFAFLDGSDLHQIQTVCSTWQSTINAYPHLLELKLIKNPVFLADTRFEKVILLGGVIEVYEFCKLWNPSYVVNEIYLHPFDAIHCLKILVGRHDDCPIRVKRLKIFDRQSWSNIPQILLKLKSLICARDVQYIGNNGDSAYEILTNHKTLHQFSYKTLTAKFEDVISWSTNKYVDFITCANPEADFRYVEFRILMITNYGLVPHVYEKFMNMDNLKKFITKSVFYFRRDTTTASFIVNRIVDFMSERHEVSMLKKKNYVYNVFMAKRNDWKLIVEFHFNHGICIQVKQGENPEFELEWNED